MTRRRRFTRSAAWVCSALQLVVSFGLGVSSVLCVGDDGHFAIESAIAGDCCADPVVAGATAKVAAHRSATEACDCTDTPLLQPMLDRRAPTERQVHAATAHRLPPSAGATGPRPHGCSLAAVPPRSVGADLAALRSIVLLV
jgi:hypothetical protein